MHGLQTKNLQSHLKPMRINKVEW